MAAQTKAVLDNGAEILKAAGMGPEHVVASRVFITDVKNFQAMNDVYRTFFTKDPPARATVVAPLMGPQFQVEITMTAVSAPKQAFTTPAADGTPGKPSPILSSAIKVGNRLYVSGMLGNTPETKGNMEAQTKETLARIGRTLTAAGFGWGDLVDGIVYITDPAQFDAMNAGYRSVVKELPARATVKPASSTPTAWSRSCSSRRSRDGDHAGVDIGQGGVRPYSVPFPTVPIETSARPERTM